MFTRLRGAANWIVHHLGHEARMFGLIGSAWKIGQPAHRMLTIVNQAGYVTTVTSSNPGVLLVTPFLSGDRWDIRPLAPGSAVITVSVNGGKFVQILTVDVTL